MQQFENVILKGIAGVYTVKTANGTCEAKAKGIFRKRGITPLPGDTVRLEQQPDSCVIGEILPRRNFFVRPTVANVDVFFLVVSTVEPVPSTWVIDQLLTMALDREVQVQLILTKNDLADGDELERIYRSSGIPVIRANAETGDGIEEIRALIAGHVCVFCGNSGVGKSTLLNAVMPGIRQETGEISKKLGRGRHTTREVQLFETCGGLVADTPGFSSLDMERMAPIRKDDLQYAFPEMKPYLLRCRFTGCSHTCEKGFAVREAVDAGKIEKSRYQSYLMMYEQAKNRHEWEN